MPIRAVLFDLDNTLFDFEESSYKAFCEVYREYGIDYSRSQFSEYSKLNDAYWAAFERGEIDRARLFTERFEIYLPTLGILEDPEIFDSKYRSALARGFDLMPHAMDVLEALRGQYKIYIVTNGDSFSQRSRLAGAGVISLADGVFISEELGCKKPEKAFFDKVFAQIGEEYRKASIIVGDNLSADMQGGRNAGILTCHYSAIPSGDARCDYEISDLRALPPLLSRIP